jgi:hypothetical protein
VTPTAAQVVDAGITGIIGLIEERAEYEKHLKEELEKINKQIHFVDEETRRVENENLILGSIRGGFYAVRKALPKRIQSALTRTRAEQ